MNQRYATGVFLALGGGVCLSMAGVLLRHVEEATGWQILFYRSLSFFATLLLILIFQYRSRTWDAFRRTGWVGVVSAVALGLGSMAYIYALLLTTVANAVFIIGAAPLVTALVGWLVFREVISGLGILAMLAAFAGIGLMFADGIVSGSWLGNVMALLVVLSFVIYLLLIRNSRHVDMLPATCLAGLVAAILAFFMADSLVIGNRDLIIAIVLGAVQFSGGFMMLTFATRHIAAAEVALFSLSEAVLAPIWVWLVVDEVPSHLTLGGSAIVLVSVIGYCLICIRRERRDPSGDDGG